MEIFWHRRDLRVPDNRGLAVAAEDGPVVPVFVIDPAVRDAVGGRQWAFFMRGVVALKGQYRDLGSDLLVRRGDPAEILSELRSQYDAERIVYNDHYRPVRREQQRAVDSAVPTQSVTDLVLVDPAGLAERYQSHSQFYNEWQTCDKRPPASVPAESQLADLADPNEPTVPDVDCDLPTAGYDGARERWEQFLDNGIGTYNDTRDDMQRAVERPIGAVSRLSPYLAAGMIGVREVWADATERYANADGDERRNIDKYRYELSWRESNYHLLYHNPDLPTDNYKSFPTPIDWRNDPEQIAAWKAGETGYPLVDAGMRQLSAEGYIHNRPRQNVASFLTKHLLVDWRIGVRHFESELIDHDPANNAGNWQWIASTGTDTVDVRIFDPVAQMAKYDDRADYVTEYVPELRGVDPEDILEWPTLSDRTRKRLAPSYPHPIVDRDDAYERAQRIFETALGKR
jgi:deoxyribodipyrimidine photo-lyase